MIDSITLRNFRAFKAQSFRLKRLNLFIGKNNSGKSSALSALNVIAQTLREDQLDSTPLIFNGQFDFLGTFIDVVNGGLARTPLGIDFQYSSYEVRLEYKYRTQRRQIELTKFELLEEGNSIYRFVSRKDKYDLWFGGRPFETVFPGAQKRRPRFRNFWPIISGAPRTYETSSQGGSDARRFREVSYEYERKLNRARALLNRMFDSFDSLSPFRDKPQRTYLYSGETARQIGNTGSNTAVMLASDASRRGGERKELIRDVSRWFEATGIARRLNVKSLTPRHFEITLVSNDGTEHNICDVGFGCSQVLPVLTAGLNLFVHQDPLRFTNTNRMLLVQEPEIHLHPNAQAAMGSFFVDLARRGGQLFVETHSDNLVLRIARHVALGDIDADDVAIFFVSDTADRRVTEITISSEGTFAPEWPGGFFPQRQTESLELARAAMKPTQRPSKQLGFVYPEESE